MGRLITGHNQYDEDDGDVASGCKLYFYETGTLTAKTTYSDEALTTPNSNPVVCDAWGRQADIWFDGAARLRVYDSDDVLLYEIDPIYTTATSGGSGAGGAGLPDDDPWVWYQASTTYSEYDLVVDPTTRLWYQSIADSNQNNALTDATYWVNIGPIYIWNNEKTFRTNDFAYYSGLLYRSKTDSNQNNTPSTDLTNWEALGYQFRHNDEGTITNGSTVTLDVVAYNRFTFTKASSADITVAFSNEAAILALDWVIDIKIINGNFLDTITWPSNVEWPYGVEPEWSISGEDVVTLIKYPGDSTWFASLYTQGSS